MYFTCPFNSNRMNATVRKNELNDYSNILRLLSLFLEFIILDIVLFH